MLTDTYDSVPAPDLDHAAPQRRGLQQDLGVVLGEVQRVAVRAADLTKGHRQQSPTARPEFVCRAPHARPGERLLEAQQVEEL